MRHAGRELTITTGKVVKVEDPDGLGRVLVRLPWLQGKPELHWAPVATLMSGDGHGSFFLPEKGDDVLVAFDRGSVNDPYVVGCLWNGKRKPPTSGINERVRRLRTPGGHVLEFDDNDDAKAVRVHTDAGHVLELDDKAGTVRLETDGGQSVELQDSPARATVATRGGGSVTLEGGAAPAATVKTGMCEVKLADSPPGITITAPTAALSVTCREATVSASTRMTVAAPMTQFAGMVQAPLITAGAVTAGAFSPGVPGNLLGL